MVAAPAPQAPLSPKRVGSSSNPEGYACLTSFNGRKYYMHDASGRCMLHAPPHLPCLLCLPCSFGSAVPSFHTPDRGTWSVPGSAQAAAEVKEVRGRLLMFLLLMRALQLEQMLVSGGVRQQAGSSYVAYLVPMALLGVLCAYAYSMAKFA